MSIYGCSQCTPIDWHIHITLSNINISLHFKYVNKPKWFIFSTTPVWNRYVLTIKSITNGCTMYTWTWHSRYLYAFSPHFTGFMNAYYQIYILIEICLIYIFNDFRKQKQTTFDILYSFRTDCIYFIFKPSYEISMWLMIQCYFIVVM